jgi:hypothetical protein
MKTVIADIIRPDVPLEKRLCLAGDHQFQQSQVTAMTLSTLAKHIVTVPCSPDTKPHTRLQLAVRITGFERTETLV